MIEEDKKKKSKLGKLVGGAVGSAAAIPVVASSIGWAGVTLLALASVACIILVVKELKK